jgi:hypothetical protein
MVQVDTMLDSLAISSTENPPQYLSILKRPLDLFFVSFFCVFAITSFVFDPYIVFSVDISTSTDIVGRSWFWYARSYDPVFLDTPLWLRILLATDAFILGPLYPFLIYAFVRSRNWIRIPAIIYGTMLAFSTLIYFSWEFLDIHNRQVADLFVVVLVNIPYTIVALLVMWRVRKPEVFSEVFDSYTPSFDTDAEE